MLEKGIFVKGTGVQQRQIPGQILYTAEKEDRNVNSRSGALKNWGNTMSSVGNGGSGHSHWACKNRASTTYTANSILK